jgi:tetratricopeptide (TPR) repeat protein
MGCYYYFCRNDNQKALEYFNRTAVLDPTNYQPLYYMALVYRKRGEWEKSQYLISKVIQQNPQVPLFLTNIGLSYNYLHKFDSAIMYHQKAIDIMPEWSAPYVNKIESLILKGGKTKECRRLISLTESNTGRKLTELEIRLDLYDGKLKEALNLAENLETLGYHDLIRKLMACATISQLLNDRAKAAVYYDSALVAMGNVEMDYTLHGEAAIAYAGLDNKEKAMAEAKLSVDLSANNKMDESDMRMNQAKVLTMLGDYDSAVNSIKYLLENPSAFSKKLLQLDPVWKPLLKTPAGSRLLEEYSE